MGDGGLVVSARHVHIPNAQGCTGKAFSESTMSEYVFCMRELSLRRNWEWREVTDVDGKLTTGCFATVSMPKAQQLEPRMEFPGRKLIKAQVKVLRAANRDADVILVDNCERHIAGIQGSGGLGVHSIRLPLARSVARGYIAQRFRANCTYSTGNVHLIQPVSAGDELFMQADRHREAAVLKAFCARYPITDVSSPKVLVAEDDPGLPRSTGDTLSLPRYTIRDACAVKEWADEDGLTLYNFKSLYDTAKILKGAWSDEDLEVASLIHWEDAANKKHGRTFLEPPSEYVEIASL